MTSGVEYLTIGVEDSHDAADELSQVIGFENCGLIRSLNDFSHVLLCFDVRFLMNSVCRAAVSAVHSSHFFVFAAHTHHHRFLIAGPKRWRDSIGQSTLLSSAPCYDVFAGALHGWCEPQCQHRSFCCHAFRQGLNSASIF